MVLRYLIEKEFKQLMRNPIMPRMIIMMPLMTLLLLPLAANMEIKNINLVVVDNDHSTTSRRLIEKASSSGYFRLVADKESYDAAIEQIELGDADLIVEIPPRFERDLISEGNASVLIAANAVNGAKGSIGSGYMGAIVANFNSDITLETGNLTQGGERIEVTPQMRFNPYMDYKVSMVPAFMMMLLTMMCGFMPALNIVSEKEIGTIEQINVTPVSRFQFILAKMIPYWVIGYIVLTIGFIIAYLVYGQAPAGSIFTIYACALVYVLAMAGLGLIVSNNSTTMQQAMFVMLFFQIVFMLMSGLFTPIASMPEWAQYITYFNPLRYFTQIMRMIYLKGSTLGDLSVQLGALAAFAVVLNTIAILSYRKRS